MSVSDTAVGLTHNSTLDRTNWRCAWQIALLPMYLCVCVCVCALCVCVYVCADVKREEKVRPLPLSVSVFVCSFCECMSVIMRGHV